MSRYFPLTFPLYPLHPPLLSPYSPSSLSFFLCRVDLLDSQENQFLSLVCLFLLSCLPPSHSFTSTRKLGEEDMHDVHKWYVSFPSSFPLLSLLPLFSLFSPLPLLTPPSYCCIVAEARNLPARDLISGECKREGRERRD